MTISRTGVPNGTALPARWQDSIRQHLTGLLQPADFKDSGHLFGRKGLAVTAILVALFSSAACSTTDVATKPDTAGLSARLAGQPTAKQIASEQNTAKQLQPTHYLQPLTAEDITLLSEHELFDSKGLRISRYRAPVPSQAPGAMTLSNSDFIALKEQNRLLLIDVLPATLRESRFINTRQHKTIPGSFWLANTGKADAPESINQYFSAQLSILMAHYPDKTPVFFCKTDCWMSWNAATKASALGIKPLYWYPAGVDGWKENGGELVLQAPVPLSTTKTWQSSTVKPENHFNINELRE